MSESRNSTRRLCSVGSEQITSISTTLTPQFNTTLMLVGSDPPLTVMMYGRMREGASPVLNAMSLFLMAASALIALVLLRRPSRDYDGRVRRAYLHRPSIRSCCEHAFAGRDGDGSFEPPATQERISRAVGA